MSRPAFRPHRRIPAAIVGVALTAGVAVTPAAHAAAAERLAGRGRPPAGVQAAADRLVADGKPGVIVMTRRGRHVAHVTSGVADRATGAPMDHRLLFRTASVGKTYTSAIVLQLAAKRRLSLNDTVHKWLPGVVTGNGNDGRKITIRQLLQQTSGLNDYFKDRRIQAQPDRTWTPLELVGIAMEQPPQPYVPGEGWNYANTNYILAGMIIEKVTGHPFDEELNERIIKPLKLKETSMPISDLGFPGPYVHGYFGSYGDVSTKISPSIAWAAGSITSTVDDVATFHQALFTGQLLYAAQQRELTHTTGPVNDDGIVEDYGLGVARIKFSCGYGWGHDGGWPGYRTFAYISADGRRQAIITYNEHGPGQDTTTFRAHLTKAIDTAFCA